MMAFMAFIGGLGRSFYILDFTFFWGLGSRMRNTKENVAATPPRLGIGSGQVYHNNL